MAKDQEKKRKLERELFGQGVSTKRARKIESGQLPNGSNVNELNPSTSLALGQSTKTSRKSQEQRQNDAMGKRTSKTGPHSDERSSESSPGMIKSTGQDTLISPKSERGTRNEGHGGNHRRGNMSTASNCDSEKITSQAVAGLESDRSRADGAWRDEDADLKPVESLSTSKQSSWAISSRSGGAYIDQDPVFVRDEHGESCVISANQYEILLMSLETSQVVRSYAVPDGRCVACFCLSRVDESLLQVAYDNGEVVQWDWRTSITTPTDHGTEGRATSMLEISLSSGKAVTYRIVHWNGNFSILRNKETLYKTKNRLIALQVFCDADYVIALSPSALVVGKKRENKVNSLGAEAGTSYTWVHIPSSRYSFTCFDARITEGLTKNKKGRNNPVKLAVALGNEHGQIYLYSDVLSALSADAQLPAPRILHWHPELVSTVRFTESGYYLLSGGKETVLVFWQLDTGKRSYLPHLPAEIERLVLSPDGTQYALLLGDNSILILSSTEQKAVANFPGLQIPAALTAEQNPVLPKITAVLHPQNAHHLLLTVPASSPKRPSDITARPFLQTFDIRNSRHIGRQALARNTITDFNTGPDMRPVIPPDVHLLAVSQDGRWLATLDEWIPQAFDLKHLVPRSIALSQMELEEVQEQQQKREEVFLKFWRWQNKTQTWALNTRIESPHGSAVDTHVNSGPGQVFKLVADPASNGFVTVGEDGHVKVWQPKTRTRHGVPLKNGKKEELMEWVCKRDTSLPTSRDDYGHADSPMDSLATVKKISNDEDMAPSGEDATLAISEDGSIIACALLPASLDDHPVVHFISATTGEITAARTYLAAPGSNLVAMAFLKRYFITLSANAVRVWDLIEDELEYTIDLPDVGSHGDEPMLAVDLESETFAVLSCSPSGSSRALRTLRIYDPHHQNCLFDTAFPNMPLAVLAGKKGRSYTVLFDDSTIRNIFQNNSAARLMALDLATTGPNFSYIDSSTAEANSEIVNIEMDSPQEDAEMIDGPSISTDEDTVPFDYTEDDRPVVRPEQLASVFDVGSSSSLPPVKDMFHAVVELFARKPRLERLDGDAMEIDA